MASENTPDRTLGDRVAAHVDAVSDRYSYADERVRNYTPYVVRAIEVVLAIALLAYLAHWVYWVYVLGA